MRSWTGFDGDEFIFALVGRDVLDGHLPYSLVFDNKPPGLVYVFALAEAAFGRTTTALHILSAIAALATASLAYLDARDRQVPRPVALGIAALFSTLIITLDGWAAMSELIACPGVMIVNRLLIRPPHSTARAIVAGALMGLVCQITYLAVPVVGVTVLAVAATSYRGTTARLRMLAAIGGGFAGATLLIWSPQIATDNLIPMLQAQFAYHAHYRGPFSLGDFTTRFLLPAIALAAPFLAVAPARVPSHDRATALVLGLQLAGAAGATIASNRFYLHYLLLTLPSVSGLLVVLLVGDRRRNWKLAGAILLAFATLYLVIEGVRMPSRWPDGVFDAVVASKVERDVGRARPVLMFNEAPTFYLLSDSQPVTRYVFARHYMPTCSDSDTMEKPEKVLADGLRRRPALVLLGRECKPIRTAASTVAAAGYHFTGTLKFGLRQVDIYAPR
jgi:hypothetical protein